jgi:hypothetical protein
LREFVVGTLRLVLLGALVLAVGVASDAVRAQSPAAGGADVALTSAPNWDLNHDGIYTCDEWKQYAARLFNMAAPTHDGIIDAKQFDVIRRADPVFSGADFDYFDDNKDGRLSLSEFVDKPNPLFARYDRNHDCRITPDELKAKAAPPPSRFGARRPGGMDQPN